MKIVRFLAFPFSIIYAIVTSIRNWFFDVGIFKSTQFEKPIIAVGNLSVGGTGKTPQIEYLIRLLNSQYRVGVLSRGYGRKTKGFILANNSSSAESIGDEPLQFYQKFKKITVAVDEKRVRGIQHLGELKNAPEIILLDDAFQHRQVKAGFSVLLTKYDDLFSNDFVLPTGNLRERRVGVKRANIVVVTKCPKNISNEDQQETKQLIKRYFDGPIFFSTIKYATLLLNANSQQILTENLSNYKVLLVTGIANPSSMLAYLSELGCAYTHVNFPDHHQFTPKEIDDLNNRFEKLEGDNKIILTTEKDFVRLSNNLENLYYLAIETSFVNQQKEFDDLITDYVAESL